MSTYVQGRVRRGRKEETELNVLVTGGAGYIGSVLVPMLVNRGHGVRIVDSGWFGLDHVDGRAELINEDILDFDRSWLDRIDAVIHLAGLSNDPMAAFSPTLNYMLNTAAPGIVAQATKEANIRRFVFASSCSIYGFNDAVDSTEKHRVRPTFPYAIAKLMVERLLHCLEDTAFRPIVLRMGTVVGWSPRMRFDLVTNTMVKSALMENRILVHNPDLWRPLIDVQDAARAFIVGLEADLSTTGVFNIATGNYTIGQLATEVAAALFEFGLTPEVQVEHWPDVRSYRVDCTKAEETLRFRASRAMALTVKEIMRKVQADDIRKLDDPRYYNIAQMKKLAAQGALPWLGARVRRDLQFAAART